MLQLWQAIYSNNSPSAVKDGPNLSHLKTFNVTSVTEANKRMSQMSPGVKALSSISPDAMTLDVAK